MRRTIIALFLSFFLIALLKAEVTPLLLYKSQQDKDCEDWVEATLSQMSLKEKVGQLFIYTIAPTNNRKNLALLREVTHTYKVGALLFAGGALENQALLTNYAQKQAKIPLMITFDGEWGLAMRLKDTPDFPRNMVLGCIQDDRLIYRYGQEVARECKELGVDVNFAPVADVNINPNNPVINTRSFGENPNNVANKVIAYASGLESGGVLSVAKHFPGHGDTDIDSHLALPVLPFTRERLDSVELYPFKQAIRAGVSGIMVGHLQVPVLDHDNQFPSSLSHNIVYGLLREELKFKGLIFTDALAMKGVSKTENVCVRALKAGNDMVLTPRNIEEEMNSVMEALKSGTLTQESIENKCRKVLMYKYALGIQRKRAIRMSGLERRINTPEAEKLIRELRLAAVTVVENKKQVLPLHQDKSALAVVSIGDSKADSAFIRSLEKYAVIDHYHLTEKLSDSARQVLKQTLATHKRVVVSITTTNVKAFDSFLAEVSTAVSTIYTLFTPVAVMDKLKMPLSLASAVVLSHSGETEVLAHTANALFGKVSVDGRLSVSVQGLYKEGYGVTITPNTPHYYDPEEYGMRAEILSRIDSIVYEGIAKGAFPGCQVVILKDGKPVYDRSFGTLTYEDKNRKVKSTDLYDLASLSKTTGTLLAVMKLYDQGRFNLTDKVSQYLPFLRGTNKENITISELLFHQSGLPPSLPFYRETLDPTSYKGKKLTCSSLKYKDGMTSNSPSSVYALHVADSLYVNKSFRQLAYALIAKAPMKAKKYVYSCVNFILLKELVEQISHRRMDAFLENEFYAPMGINRTLYLPLRIYDKKEIAPSVKDDCLRGGVLRGYVHDESAAFLGGVSGNAGLFSSARNVAEVYQLLLNEGKYEGKVYLSKETCRLFTTMISKISRRGLGFDKPDAKDLKKSPCSVSTPTSVYGHTGFTGTCAWADPEHNLVYVFLSNRTYPEPSNNKLLQMNIRPRIQEIVYQSLEE